MSILDWSSSSSAAESLPPFPAALLSALAVLTASLSVATAVRRLGRQGVDLRGTSGVFHRLHPILGALAVLCFVVAAFNPKVRGGTRLVPRTPLDVVFVIDTSRSMLAADVTPTRLSAVRAAVEAIVDRFPQARFGAVTYAGEPLAFPLTGDGPALVGLLREVDPDNLPVGGTATARALQSARELFARDPYAGDHEKVVLLLTDGDDGEGGLEEAARALAAAHIYLHVGVVGGRAPAPVPPRPQPAASLPSGHPVITTRSAEGEAALARAAVVGNGEFLPPKRGVVDLTPFTRAVEGRLRGPLAVREEVAFRGLDQEFALAGCVVLALDLALAIALRRRRTNEQLAREPWAGGARAARVREQLAGMSGPGGGPP